MTSGCVKVWSDEEGTSLLLGQNESHKFLPVLVPETVWVEAASGGTGWLYMVYVISYRNAQNVVEPNEIDQIGKFFTATSVVIDSVDVDIPYPTICEEVTFTVTTDPVGYEKYVQWSGGGCYAVVDEDNKYISRWSCTGDKTVTASLCDNIVHVFFNVSLPPDCYECTASPEVSLGCAGGEPQMSTECFDCSINCPCGVFNQPLEDPADPALDINVCYDSSNCEWEFGVSATATVTYGPCNENPFLNYLEISDGDSAVLTEDNYCDIVDAFDYDIVNASTGTGCAPINISDCEQQRYSNTNCIWAHEARHAFDFTIQLNLEEELLRNNPIMSMPIDCNASPELSYCNYAIAYRYGQIEAAVKDAYLEAWLFCASDVGEQHARETAYECFHELAIEICNRASREGWSACPSCGD